jgi:hypothetical protein
LGRHVPHLQALNILLGDEPVLTTDVRFYQRLLALDSTEAREIVLKALKQQPLEDVYDQIILPALSLAEQDRYRSDVRDARMEYICQSTSQIVEELVQNAEAMHGVAKKQPASGRIFCVGTTDYADRVTAAMLAQVLEQKGWVAVPLSSEALDVVAKPNDIICLCALPPLAVMHARTHAKQMRERFPDIKIFVCLWGLAGDHFERAGGMLPGTLVTSMRSAGDEVCRQLSSMCAETTAATTQTAASK